MMNTALTAQDLRGTITAVVTPFTEGGEVDYGSFKKFLQWQLKSGVNGVVVCGSTGEAATLSESEYEEVVKFVVSELGGKIPVIAGIGTNNTRKACEQAKFLEGAGVDGILLVVPPYSKPSQEGIVAHFTEVKKSSRLPIVAYNVPGRTGTNLTPATVKILTESKTIIAIKEASGNFDQILDLIALCGGEISILSGDDSSTFALIAHGGQGIISVAANAVPDLFSKMTTLALNKEFDAALALHNQLLPLMRVFFSESNPIPVKYGVFLQGQIATPHVRLPLLVAKDATISTLKNLLNR